MKLDDVLGDVEEYLTYIKEEGSTVLEVDRAVLDELGRIPKKTTASVSETVEGDDLQAVSDIISKCTKCSLSETRTHTVPGQGNPTPEILFIGEAPGADEDKQGLAFVGRAGQLLTKMIIAMGLTRDEVFIANILKCRPPENRKPTPEEIALCLPYLKKQIALLKPKVIIALGATSVHGLLNDATPISKIRGKWMEFEGIKLMPTFHPSYLLRNPPGAKKHVWDDLQEVLKVLGRKPNS
jgi:uracil-DNA glycosylase family 4